MNMIYNHTVVTNITIRKMIKRNLTVISSELNLIKFKTEASQKFGDLVDNPIAYFFVECVSFFS